jgi:hypothetical protein
MDTLPEQSYSIQTRSVTISKDLIFDTICIKFRTFSFELEEKYQLLDPGLIQRDRESPKIAYDLGLGQEPYSLFNTKGLEYNGSFGRTINVGNAQNLVLNSNFNLQLSGAIGDEIEVLAAISDNNLPIQPEGNTQQLQEFDKVFVQLSKAGHKLIAGDHDLLKPTGYFIRMRKKLSGLSYQNQASLKKGYTIQSQSGFALSRGKYARNELITSEGNQGPYNLVGNEGEKFIVVLAGTERVFLDGQALTRGANADYIIDYNLGQITFTTQVLITKDSRIITEFEYSDQQFGRATFTANTKIESDKNTFYFNLYHQQDGKTTSGEFALDSTDLSILSLAGDPTGTIFRSGIRPSESEDINDRITYILVDTFYFLNGQRIDTTVLKYNSNPNETNAYIARFSDLGPGNGSYSLALSSANGRIYQWQAPDAITGEPQGAYSPEIPLEAPQIHQMMSLGVQSKISEKFIINSEVVLSRKDLNRYSSLNDNDNIGIGAFLESTYKQDVGDKDWSFIANARIEANDNRLESISPYRPQEFTRDWNLLSSEKTQEVLSHVGLGMINKIGSKFLYRAALFDRKTTFTGINQSMDINHSFKGWHISGQPSYLISNSSDRKSEFWRPTFSLSKSISKWKDLQLGISYQGEKNERKDGRDTLIADSYAFSQWGMKVDGPKWDFLQTNVNFSYRTDDLAFENELTQTSEAINWGLTTNLTPVKSFSMKLDLKYRDLEVKRPDLIKSQSQKSLLSRTETRATLFRGFLKTNAVYELSSGQEPRIEYAFEERQPGAGNYIYQDLNGDGIRQINEYIAAPFADTARYVRIQLLNTGFIKTNNLGFSQNIRLKPEALWDEESPTWAKRLVFASLFKSNNKKNQSSPLFNPFLLNDVDSQTVSFNVVFQNNIYINQGHPDFDIHLGHRILKNSITATFGNQDRRQSEWLGRFRRSLGQRSELLIHGSYKSDLSDSQFFTERDYDLTVIEFRPEWNIVLDQTFRFNVLYKLTYKENRPQFGGELVAQNEGQLEGVFRRAGTDAVKLKMNYTHVRFVDKGNESLNYTILQGLRDGNNFQWAVSYDRVLFNNIQLTLGYDGRKNGQGKILHSGRASLRANF